MPVNEKHGSNELQEKGWNKMHGILDLEIPQNRKKKLGLWIPLGLSGVAIIVFLMIGISNMEVPEAVPEKQTDPHKSFVHSEVNENANANSEFSNEVVLESNRVVENSKGADLPTGLAINTISEEKEDREDVQQPVGAVHDRSASGMDAQPYLGNEVVAIIKNDQPEVYITEAGVTKSVAEETEPNTNGLHMTPGINEEFAQAVRVEERHENLSTAPSVSLAPLSHDFDAAVTPIIPAATQIKPKVGLEIFGSSHLTQFELQGVEAGALATLTLGRKWKILGGVSYGHYDVNGLINAGNQSASFDVEKFIVPVVIDTTAAGYPAVDPEIAYSKINYDTARLLAQKFNYLHFPILAQYRIGRFVSVTGGLKVSYLFSAPSDKDLSAAIPNNSLGSLFDLNNSSNFLDEENILRKWDVAPVIGLAMDLGRRLAFDIHYQHGLIPFVDRPTDSDRSDYHRSLSLGLRYRIF